MMILLLKILFYGSLIGTQITDSFLQKHLDELFKECSKIEFEVVSPSNYELMNLSYDPTREIKLASDYAYLPVKNLSNGKTVNSVITLKLNLYKKVFVAKRDISKNEFLSPTDFYLAEKKISDLRFEPLSYSSSLNRYRSKFRISENSVLVENMIEIIPDIQTGDKVNALYSNNSVSISFPVTSRSEGIAGNIIRVRDNQNNIFKARILNNSTVKIIE